MSDLEHLEDLEYIVYQLKNDKRHKNGAGEEIMPKHYPENNKKTSDKFDILSRILQDLGVVEKKKLVDGRLFIYKTDKIHDINLKYALENKIKKDEKPLLEYETLAKQIQLFSNELEDYPIIKKRAMVSYIISILSISISALLLAIALWQLMIK